LRTEYRVTSAEVKIRKRAAKVKSTKKTKGETSEHPVLITQHSALYFPRTISSACRRVLSVILSPPSMRATSSTRSGSLSFSTVVTVLPLLTSLRTT